ncbi:MAG: PDZ domain-containing protein [Gammaproteobacteria bacterium]|nr:PDZ domain-containing protein [Gammaproteobacteria bacterium]
MNIRLLFLTPLAAVAALAAPVPPALAQSDPQPAVTAEQRLEEASRRLEEAAREVARLSAEVHGAQDVERFEFRLGGPPRAMLGVVLGDSDADLKGVRVTSVSPGGPAAEAGVRAGDVIVAMDGNKVRTGREVVRAMREVEPGRKVALELRRDSRPLRIEVEARAREGVGPGPMGGMFVPDWTPMPPDHFEHWLLGGWGDAELATLTPALARYFGTDKGVLVVRAPSGVKELQDGDVIQSIGGREPADAPHAMRILHSYQSGENVEMRVLRERRSLTVRFAVPEQHRPGPMRRHRIIEAVPAPLAPPPPPAPEADRT